MSGQVYIFQATTMHWYIQRYVQVLLITVSVYFHSSQIFEEVEEMVVSVLDGFKAAIFAYGQTGSGKTHTMKVCIFVLFLYIYIIYCVRVCVCAFVCVRLCVWMGGGVLSCLYDCAHTYTYEYICKHVYTLHVLHISCRAQQQTRDCIPIPLPKSWILPKGAKPLNTPSISQ